MLENYDSHKYEINQFLITTTIISNNNVFERKALAYLHHANSSKRISNLHTH